MSAIVQLYVRKVTSGQMTLDDVPIRWQEEVRKAIENGGGNGADN